MQTCLPSYLGGARLHIGPTAATARSLVRTDLAAQNEHVKQDAEDAQVLGHCAENVDARAAGVVEQDGQRRVVLFPVRVAELSIVLLEALGVGEPQEVAHNGESDGEIDREEQRQEAAQDLLRSEDAFRDLVTGCGHLGRDAHVADHIREHQNEEQNRCQQVDQRHCPSAEQRHADHEDGGAEDEPPRHRVRRQSATPARVVADALFVVLRDRRRSNDNEEASDYQTDNCDDLASALCTIPRGEQRELLGSARLRRDSRAPGKVSEK